MVSSDLSPVKARLPVSRFACGGGRNRAGPPSVSITVRLRSPSAPRHRCNGEKLMFTTRLNRLLTGATFTAALALTACSIDVREDELRDRKNVDIRTPVGAMSVRAGIAADTGLAVYPDSRPLRDDDEPQ